MEYRRANRGDIERFVENRVEFAASIRQIDELELFRKRTRDYVEEHMEKDDMVIFIAVEGDRIISSCMACIFHTAPLPSCPTGVCAELLNVYTVQGYRRRGHAEKLLRMLIKEAGRLGVGKILLDATQMGRPLYEKLGFVPLSDQMQLKLQGDYL